MNTMTKLYLRMISHRPDQDKGATMVEYGLMVALIAIVAIAGATVLGINVSDVFTDAGDKISDAGTTP